MKSHRYALALTLALIAVFGAKNLSAHGWIVPPPPPPAGLGEAPDATVSGLGDATAAESTAEPTAEPAPEPARSTATTPTPRITVSNLAPRGATPVGRATPRTRGKSKMPNWNSKLSVPWQAAFPTHVQRNGYDGELLSVDASLTTAVEDGGWARNADRPSVVIIYDVSRSDHQRAVEQLSADTRFLSGANLFNCYRVDARTLDAKDTDVRLRTYDRDGKFVSEARGTRKVRGAFDVLEKAWNTSDATPLTKVLPRANALLVECAKVTDAIHTYEGGVVCPDCGEERHDIRRALVEMNVNKATYVKALEALK